ncbi:MAG: CoA-binding protein [Sporomusaceae bacterium]|nr:CoA-binding protein [Sporomusaceae bacterium]
MDTQVKEMLAQKRWAVYGASANPDKFGYRIFKTLKRYGYEVYPVNPRESAIDGDPCFASLSALPAVVEVVDFVVPPAVALQGLDECARLGIGRVWLQPGVNTPETVARAKQLGLAVVHQFCAIVESSKLAMLKEKRWAVAGAAAEELLGRLRLRGYELAPLDAPLPQTAAALIAGPAAATAAALRQCKAAGIEYVWLEPGAETEPLIELALSLRLTVVHHASLLDELAQLIPADG